MLAFEGPDGSGKSYLLAEVASRFDLSVDHSGGPILSRQDFAERRTKIFARAFERSLQDRLPWISEMVYGPIAGRNHLRGQDLHEFCFDISHHKQNRRFAIVYCRPDIRTLDDFKSELVPKVSSNKSERYVKFVQDNYTTIVKAYDRVMMWVAAEGLRVIPFNRDTQDVEDFLQCAGLYLL